MIIEVRVNNCFSFSKPIVFSMKADMRNKKFASNVHKENNFNILKTVGVYGPNNAGKTCLVKCINAVKRILLNKKPDLVPNLFTESTVCELGITFLSEGLVANTQCFVNNENLRLDIGIDGKTKSRLHTAGIRPYPLVDIFTDIRKVDNLLLQFTDFLFVNPHQLAAEVDVLSAGKVRVEAGRQF